MDQMGVLDSLFPFLLIFTVIFAFLQKSKVLGSTTVAGASESVPRKNFNLIIAVIFAAMTVIPHVMGNYPPGADPVTVINNALPNVSLLVVMIIALFIILSMFAQSTGMGEVIYKIMPIPALILLLYIFADAAGLISNGVVPSWLGFLSDPDTRGTLAVIAAFVVAISFISSTPSEKKGEGFNYEKTWLRRLFQTPAEAWPGTTTPPATQR